VLANMPVIASEAKQSRTARTAFPLALDCFVASLLAMTVVGISEAKQRKTNMTGAETLEVARDAIWTIVVVSSPLMVVGLVVGVVVSLFQALTQIQEQTLVFVPKIIAIFVTLLLALPFMADSLQAHMMRISSRIIGG
jgi:flagellar biosynthesis protein FliQ